MRRACLQLIKNRVTDASRIASKTRIPKPHRFDAARLQKFCSLRIMLLLIGKTVMTAVKFDVQFRFLAKEIEKIGTNGMTAPEFIGVEAPIAQPVPEEFFRPRLFFTKLPGAFDVGHVEKIGIGNEMGKVSFLARPHPNPLPRGEGITDRRSWFSEAALRESSRW